LRKRLLFCLLLAVLSSCASAPRAWQGSHRGLLDGDEAENASDITSPQAKSVSYNKHAIKIPALEEVRYAKGIMHWPLREVKVTSRYGQRGSEFHEGVDLHAHLGTAVYAADAGVVLYSGTQIRGYGKLVILKHKGGWSTIYAHNSRLFVRAGQKIQRGQRISLSGNTGRSSGPHLHFEIRRGVFAIDPMRVMPQPRYRVASYKRRLNS